MRCQWPTQPHLPPAPYHASTVPPCPPLPSLQPRWEQEDAHDFLEFLVDRMHLELLRLARAGAAGVAAPSLAPSAAEREDEWLTKSGRRLAKRQQLRADEETAVSALFRGTYVRWGRRGGWDGLGALGWPAPLLLAAGRPSGRAAGSCGVRSLTLCPAPPRPAPLRRPHLQHRDMPGPPAL